MHRPRTGSRGHSLPPSRGRTLLVTEDWKTFCPRCHEVARIELENTEVPMVTCSGCTTKFFLVASTRKLARARRAGLASDVNFYFIERVVLDRNRFLAVEPDGRTRRFSPEEIAVGYGEDSEFVVRYDEVYASVDKEYLTGCEHEVKPGEAIFVLLSHRGRRRWASYWG